VGTMSEAMKKAGLISQAEAEEAAQRTSKSKNSKNKKTRRKEKAIRKSHEDWAQSNFINRFGDIALFEIWLTTGAMPSDYLRICALCGKRNCELTDWKCPCQGNYNICGECFSAESRRQ